MKPSELLEIALTAGEIMLRYGAETYRVEDTMVRICKKANIRFVESFVIPTGIVATITDENGNFITISKRIKNRTIDLNKIALVNQFSRDFAKNDISFQEALNTLKNIESKKSYKFLELSLSAGLACSFSTILFKGSYKDAISSFIVGFISQSAINILNKKGFSWFMTYIIGGFLTALVASITVFFNLGESLDKIIIGSVLIMTPGVAITNAIRDTIAGDLLSGVARAIEAVLVAVFIAIGAGIALFIGIKLLGGNLL
ncbi:threonine/serine exporter ThrE family protein [Caldicellulosiruptoraceae bacterium PP1]